MSYAWTAPAFPACGMSLPAVPKAIAPVPAMPLDLRLWVEESQLVGWIEEAVRDGVQGTADDQVPNRLDLGVQRLLQVLAYALLTGPADSATIASRCSLEQALRTLAGGIRPFPQELTEFRRMHRQQLQAILAEILDRVWTDKFGPAREAHLRARQAECRRLASERLNLARHLDWTEE